jgi:hypothetical protein
VELSNRDAKTEHASLRLAVPAKDQFGEMSGDPCAVEKCHAVAKWRCSLGSGDFQTADAKIRTIGR